MPVVKVNKILWRPSSEWQKHTHITHFIEQVSAKYRVDIADYHDLYCWSIDYPAEFWSFFWDFAQINAASKGTVTVSHFEKMPGAEWFPEARLNYAQNLLCKGKQNQCAIACLSENGSQKKISYAQLYESVSRLTQALRQDGVKQGDRVVGVLPNVPETIIAMLATASIGAVWSSCSPDFGVPGIVDRFAQIDPKIIFVCDGYHFNGKTYDRSRQIEPLLNALPSIKKAILIPVLNQTDLLAERFVTLWQDYLADFSSKQPIAYTQTAFGDPLFILFSSGTTGPPKCIVHGVGGTLLQHMKEHLLHVDIHPGDRLFYYTTCGWMMWNWLASGLASQATLVLYDGAPLYPSADALFDLIDAYQINTFGISAKYIDAIKKAGLIPKESHDLSSLKTILSTGSPLVPEGFDYVYEAIKSDVCLSSISGGTDIVSCFVLGCPILPVYRGEIQCRGLAMQVDIYDDSGNSLRGGKGELVCTAPFPSMPVGFWNDPEQKKYHAAYFEKYPGVWWHGDYSELTEHDGVIIYGRSDAVLNPGGVRIGTAEIYRQVEQHDEVLESLVVGQDYEGDCRIVLFVVLRSGVKLSEQLQEKIKQGIRQNASPRHVPAIIRQVTDIPRTKSGKIVELAVRDMVNARPVKNQHALANPEALQQFAGLVNHE